MSDKRIPIEVEKIEVMSLSPDDILILHVSEPLPPLVAHQFVEALKKLGIQNNVIFLQKKTYLEKLSDDDLNKLNLRRKEVS